MHFSNVACRVSKVGWGAGRSVLRSSYGDRCASRSFATCWHHCSPITSVYAIISMTGEPLHAVPIKLLYQSLCGCVQLASRALNAVARRRIGKKTLHGGVSWAKPIKITSDDGLMGHDLFWFHDYSTNGQKQGELLKLCLKEASTEHIQYYDLYHIGYEMYNYDCKLILF